jgi:hypothetical protein
MKRPSDKNFTAEMLEIKSRYGESGEIPYESSNMWSEGRKRVDRWSWSSRTNHIGDLVPIGLVTILEAVARRWIASLIDHGDPYLENARELTKGPGFELDFAAARAVTGGKLSLGEIIGHSVAIQQVRADRRLLHKTPESAITKSPRIR